MSDFQQIKQVAHISQGSAATLSSPVLTELFKNIEMPSLEIQCTAVQQLLSHIFHYTTELLFYIYSMSCGHLVDTITNKAVIDCRLYLRCCHLGSYFQAPKSSPMHPLAYYWHYCTVYSPWLHVHCASAGWQRRATLTYEQ